MRILRYPILLLLLALILLASCSAMPKSSLVEGQQREQVLAVAEPIADNLLKGMNAADYSAFSRDFDSEMKKGLDEKAFNGLVQSFSQKIGKYQSRQVENVEQIENLYTVIYQAQFEKENPVSIRLTLHQATSTTPMQVAGLWFNSPKLSTK